MYMVLRVCRETIWANYMCCYALSKTCVFQMTICLEDLSVGTWSSTTFFFIADPVSLASMVPTG